MMLAIAATIITCLSLSALDGDTTNVMGTTRFDDSGVRDRYGSPLISVRLKNCSTAGAVLLRDGYAVLWKPGYVSRWCD